MRGPADLLARLQSPLVVLFLVLFLALGWRSREPTMNAAGDDELVYLSLSKSLESGSYREAYKAGAPLHVQYPPAFPAWLVVVRHTLGENLEGIRVVNLGLAAAALLLFFLAIRQLAGPELALAALGLAALNRSLLTTASLTSEGLFLLVATAALWLMLPAQAPSSRRISGVIALALLAFLTRTIGVTLVLAVGAWLWFHRRGLLLWATSSVAVVGGWFAYSALGRQSSAVRSYASEFAIGAHASRSRIVQLAQRFWEHGVTYVTTHMPYAMSLPSIPGTFVDNWAWLVVNLILLSLGFLVFWRRWRAAAVYVFCYIALVLVWPWESARLLIPMVPLGFAAFLLGGRQVASRLAAPARNVALAALVALPAVGAIQGARERYVLYDHCDRAAPGASAGCYESARLALIAAAGYVRAHAKPGEVALTEQPASVGFLSGQPTEDTNLLPDIPPNRVLEVLRGRGIQFVFVSRPWMARTLQPFCTKLRFEVGFPPDLVLVSTGTPAANDATCVALSRMASITVRHK